MAVNNDSVCVMRTDKQLPPFCLDLAQGLVLCRFSFFM